VFILRPSLPNSPTSSITRVFWSVLGTLSFSTSLANYCLHFLERLEESRLFNEPCEPPFTCVFWSVSRTSSFSISLVNLHLHFLERLEDPSFSRSPVDHPSFITHVRSELPVTQCLTDSSYSRNISHCRFPSLSRCAFLTPGLHIVSVPFLPLS
jgi:hypothetical protein